MRLRLSALLSLICLAIPVSCSSSGTSATSPGSKIMSTCPSASDLSAAAGTTIPPLKENVSTGGGLLCSYTAPAASTGLVLSIKVGNISASAFQAAQAAAASATHETGSPLAGYGTSAYLTNSRGGAQVTVLDGSHLITVFGIGLPAAQAEAVAHFILTH